MRMSDAERKVMEVVWASEGCTAKDISLRLGEEIGWSKTTTYTMISVCVNKGYIRREDPKFHCFSKIARNDVSVQEATTLVNVAYRGAADELVADLVRNDMLTVKQLGKVYHALRKQEKAELEAAEAEQE